MNLILAVAEQAVSGKPVSPVVLDWIVKLTPLVITAVFGALGYQIAKQQAATAKRAAATAGEKLRLDLFDKRLEVVKQLAEFHSMVIRDGAVGGDAIVALIKAREMADFLFGDDVRDRLKWLKDLSMSVRRNERVAGDGKVHTGKREEAGTKWEAEIMGLINSQEETNRLMRRYLAFDQKGSAE